jgi:hypothetical protein
MLFFLVIKLLEEVFYVFAFFAGALLKLRLPQEFAASVLATIQLAVLSCYYSSPPARAPHSQLLQDDVAPLLAFLAAFASYFAHLNNSIVNKGHNKIVLAGTGQTRTITKKFLKAL